jgi:hypothetical protein
LSAEGNEGDRPARKHLLWRRRRDGHVSRERRDKPNADLPLSFALTLVLLPSFGLSARMRVTFYSVPGVGILTNWADCEEALKGELALFPLLCSAE